MRNDQEYDSFREERFDRAIGYVKDGIKEMQLTFREIEEELVELEAYSSEASIDGDQMRKFSEICTYLIGSHQLMLQNLSLAAKACAESLTYKYQDLN